MIQRWVCGFVHMQRCENCRDVVKSEICVYEGHFLTSLCWGNASGAPCVGDPCAGSAWNWAPALFLLTFIIPFNCAMGR